MPLKFRTAKWGGNEYFALMVQSIKTNNTDEVFNSYINDPLEYSLFITTSSCSLWPIKAFAN